MQKKISRICQHLILFFLTILLFFTTSTQPVYSHWSDLSVAEIAVSDSQTEVTLTFPTGLTKFADDNQDSQLQPTEIRIHKIELEKFLSQQIRITNSSNIQGSLTVAPLEIAAKTANLIQQPNTHSTLILNYTWPASNVNSKNNKLRINYNLFLPGVSTASCQATIVQAGAVKSVVFTPQNRDFLLTGNESIWASGWSLVLAVAGAFAWGCVHAMSPGHGKTIVGAYLVGSRATPVHALFLAATTTITHTAGVFAVGGITLFASNLVDPEKLDPWLNLISGLLVAIIGIKLLSERIKTKFVVRTSVRSRINLNHLIEKTRFVVRTLVRKKPRTKLLTANLEEPVNLLNRGTWEREYKPVKPLVSQHYHHHGDGRLHSHLPPGSDGSPITWKSLLVLGISGGLLPCPSALVMLLSASALGNVGLGMTLVVAFSLGLAVVLSAIGLILVYAKQHFNKLPKHIGAVKFMPAISAVLVMFLGLGITGEAIFKILVANQ
ncbi:sulfite exporter TauE/SafE family protein [Microcoleus sp. bin38.metabat.b11b12b14.051]|uniref:nickel/cobalt transporter n=1 Tax=Microcoleus sp. bin38.metabat.b11b12b14.051 TaxID=2742709 RepID=UPI0025E25064|nr:sulfite exporter TauE/SafE family protein [Microcoleus sp. bin38.metabat.b11b12b14.051]